MLVDLVRSGDPLMRLLRFVCAVDANQFWFQHMSVLIEVVIRCSTTQWKFERYNMCDDARDAVTCATFHISAAQLSMHIQHLCVHVNHPFHAVCSIVRKSHFNISRASNSQYRLKWPSHASVSLNLQEQKLI